MINDNIDDDFAHKIGILLVFAGCEVHSGGNEFDRSARAGEKAHLGRTNCDCHSVKSSETCVFFINKSKSDSSSCFLFNKTKFCRYIIIIIILPFSTWETILPLSISLK
jgi:hypothetical protein